MKNNDIQQLLERYRQGVLDDSGLAELNRLSHRDEVMTGAERRAAGIVRRRRTALFTAVGLLVAGATMWTLLAPQRSEAPLVAEAAVPEVAVETVVEQAAPVATRPVAAPVVSTSVQSMQHKAAVRPATVVQSHEVVVEETVVVCNNQCEADSVISDIWKFLTV